MGGLPRFMFRALGIDGEENSPARDLKNRIIKIEHNRNTFPGFVGSFFGGYFSAVKRFARAFETRALHRARPVRQTDLKITTLPFIREEDLMAECARAEPGHFVGVRARDMPDKLYQALDEIFMARSAALALQRDHLCYDLFRFLTAPDDWHFDLEIREPAELRKLRIAESIVRQRLAGRRRHAT